MLNRKVKIIESNVNKKNSIKSFSSCLSSRNIILLGEPGTGKTHLFESSRKHEQAELFNARNFPIHASSSISNNIVYIDGLDEQRSQHGAQGIGEILKTINQYKPQKVRISCRAADWLGDTDLEMFRPYFEKNGGFEVIVLQELTNDEIEKILSGKDEADPRKFIYNAMDHGVESLLRTPQTLLMLHQTVKSNIWPSSKGELYTKATDLLISETNEIHSRKINHISNKSIKDACGSICASILISDISDVSLISSSSSERNPHVLEIPSENLDIFSIALTTKLFQSTEYNIFTYSHRTIAEFLAAEWLAQKVKQGFSIKRLLSLITVDGHPTSELRGLFAWLVYFLPEYSDPLVTADPYGILMYADSTNLSSTIRKKILVALQQLSEADPWFRHDDWTSQSLGGLSNSEMVDTFSTILQKSENFHLRSIILDAIKKGSVLPGIYPILKSILLDKNRYISEKKSAVDAILKATPNGERNLVELYKKNLSHESGNTQLKLFLLRNIYSGNFVPEDIVEIIQEYIDSDDRRVVGDLFYFDEFFNDNELDGILAALGKLKLPDLDASYNNCITEVSYFYSKLLLRYVNSQPEYEPEKLYCWFSKLNDFNQSHYNDRQNIQKLSSWLLEHQELVRKVFEIGLERLKKSTAWMCWYQITEILLHQINITDAIDILLDKINTTSTTIKLRIKYFELAFWLIKDLDVSQSNLNYYENLMALSDSVAEFSPVVKQLGICPIEPWKRKDIERKFNAKNEKAKTNLKNRESFEKDKNIISSGEALGWMGWLAYVYFGRFRDQNHDADGRGRLVEELGEDNSAIAINGFKMVFKRDDLPTPKEVAMLYVKSKYYQWWYSVIAGMIEDWNANLLLSIQSKTLIKSVTALDLVCHVTTQKGNVTSEIIHPWMEEIKKQYPRYYKDVLWEFIWISTKNAMNTICGLNELLQGVKLNDNDIQQLINYISEYPNSEIYSLKKVLGYLCTHVGSRKELITISTVFLFKKKNLLKTEKRAVWLVVLFLFDFSAYKVKLEVYFAKRSKELWSFVEFIDSVSYQKKSSISNIDLSSKQIAFLIELMSKHFSNLPHPDEISHGSRNEWDGSENIKRKITILSTRVEESDQSLLEHLKDVSSLESYKNYIKHSIANQKDLFRQSQFIQPSWEQVLGSIFYNKPANTSELYALTQDVLNELKDTLNATNTDSYKIFWNEDSYGRVVSPKNEESGRDRLIELIRNKYEPLGIRVEPEGHMAADKRADIVLLPPPGQKLPIEIKRDTHQELWTACENQLERLYTIDPEASGFGIYLIFWYGDKRKGSMRKPPNPIEKPKSAKELEVALNSLIPEKYKNKLCSIVLDVSGCKV